MDYAIAIVVGASFGAFVGLDGFSFAAALSGAVVLSFSLFIRAGRPDGGSRPARSLPHRATWLAIGALTSALVGSQTGALPPTMGEPAGTVMVQGTVARTHCRWPPGMGSEAQRELALARLGMRCGLLLEQVAVDGTPVMGRVPLNGWREDFAAFDLGDAISTSARLTAGATQPNPGVGWPERQPWLRYRGYGTDAWSPRVEDSGTAWDRIRQDLGEGLKGPADVVALYRAMLLGDRAGLTVELRDAFVDTGTAHLLAISGLHLAVLAGALFRLLVILFMLRGRAVQLGRPRIPAAALTIAIVWSYTALVGQHSTATQRAAIFISVYLGALVMARRPTPGRSLWVALAALSLLDPRALLTPGFQLSFAAAAALIAGAPQLRRLDEWLAMPGRFPETYWAMPVRILAGIAGTTVICHFATAPLAQAWFGQTSWAGLWVNLAAVPLASVLVVPLGALWMVCASLSAGLGELVAPLAIHPARWLIDAVTSWGELWGSTQGAAMGHGTGALWAFVVVLSLLVLQVRYRHLRGVTAGLLAFAVTLSAGAAGPDGETLRMTTLDVGHGDATLVQAPNGATMLLDTGGTFDRRHRHGGGHRPSANKSLANWSVLPALSRLGVDRLDILAITHAHLDHIGAAERIVTRYRVGELWLSPCGLNKRPVRRLAKLVRRRGGKVRLLTAGRVERLGPVKIQVLWPHLPSVTDEGGRCLVGLNDGSLVMRFDFGGRRVLTTGDIEEESEEVLVEMDADALKADVLKVPHHGSRTSSTKHFVAAVNPAWAVVPGVLHSYRNPMPPHIDVLERYRRQGSHVFVTGRDGAVRVVVTDDGRLTVRSTPQGRVAR